MSKLPAVIDALVSLGKTLTDVEVYEGPGISENLAQKALHVGLSSIFDDAPQTAATTETQFLAMNGATQERIVVHCVAAAWTGDADTKTARDAAFDIITRLSQAIAADRTLGGIVLAQTILTIGSIDVAAVSNGISVQVPFDVETLAI